MNISPNNSPFLWESPFVWATSAAVIGVLGIGAALRAWIIVNGERKKIDAAKSALLGNAAWSGAGSSNAFELDQWLTSKGIGSDSFIGDMVRACWAAWLGGRAASLTELHTLVARRERSSLPAKFSSGVAALLLIIGIVGTLSSVKPILKAFQFKVSADGELQSAAESTELINSLLNNLGEAFLPSLVALVFTVFVVCFRGLYLNVLHQFSLELDRFAIGTILPQYRPPSISDEYREVRKTLGSLAESIFQREEGFSKVVGELRALSEGLHPVIMALENTTTASAQAAERLSSRSRSIADGLTKHLGGSSPIYKAVNGLGDTFERIQMLLGGLSTQVDHLGLANENERAYLRKFVEELGGGLRTLHEGNAADRRQVGEAVTTILSGMNQGLQSLHTGLAKFETQQKRHAAEARDTLMAMADNALKEAMGKVDEMISAAPGPRDRGELLNPLPANENSRHTVPFADTPGIPSGEPAPALEPPGPRSVVPLALTRLPTMEVTAMPVNQEFHQAPPPTPVMVQPFPVPGERPKAPFLGNSARPDQPESSVPVNSPKTGMATLEKANWFSGLFRKPKL
jgi:hypothetical protein